MQIGLLTAPLMDKSLEEVIAFAADAGIQALEVVSTPGGGHFDPAGAAGAAGKKLQQLLADSGVAISSFACYGNVVDPNEANREALLAHLRQLVLAAETLGVGIVCTLAGMPVPGKSKLQTIEQECPAVFAPLCEFAAKHGVKIALENWFATNLQNVACFARLFEVVPADNFGLNYDPSHLIWQGMDYLGAVEEFAPRIFHTHAKDCEIRDDKLRRLGCLEGGWWRYVIPGFGRIDWGEYVGVLRSVKYDGVLSIEHEDGTLGAEEGFRKGAGYLAQFV